MATHDLKDTKSANKATGEFLERNLSPISFDAKAYTYRITGKAEIKYLKDKNNEDITIDDYIRRLNIVEMYDKADIGYCALLLAIPTSIFKAIQDDYRNSRIILSVNRYEEIEVTKDRKPETVWKDKAFIIAGIPKSAMAEDTAGTDPADTSKTGSITNVTLNLIEEEAYNSNRTLYNFVATDVTVGEVLQYLVSKNITSKALRIGKPDNQTKYEQILIPPLNLPEAIKYLDKNYGIFKNGVSFFIGIDHLIICDKVAKTKSTKDPVEKIKISVQNGSVKGPQAGMYRSTVVEKDTAELITTTKPVIVIKDVALKEMVGEEIVLNSKNGTKVLVGGGGIKSDHEGKERYYWSGINREDLGSALNMDINETVEVITVVVENTDFRLFDVSKSIEIEFDYDMNRDYKGTYRLSDVTHNLIAVEPSEGAEDSGKLMKLITKFNVVRV